jgi:uncharacterized protein (TIGR00369 family)
MEQWMTQDTLLEQIRLRFEEAPFVRDLGMELTGAFDGGASSRLQIEPRHLQQDGFVHAGVVSTLADHTGGSAGWTLVKPSQTVLTIEFHIRFLNPARGPELTCEAKVLRAGRRITTVESMVTNPDGELAAKLSMSLAIVDTDRVRK